MTTSTSQRGMWGKRPVRAEDRLLRVCCRCGTPYTAESGVMLAPYEDQPPIKCPLCGHDRASHIPQDHKWLHQYTLARMVEERSLLAAAEFKRGVPQAQVAEKYHLSRYQVYRAIQKLERALKESQREG